MKIIICGAGDIGSHAAEVLANAGTSITVIDTNAGRLRAIEDSMDVATLCGNCAEAELLIKAGAKTADLIVAATDCDEINLLSASLGKGIGSAKSIARVHHGTFFEQRGFEYQAHLGIDRLICPEYSTALAIARVLRNPGALAIEGFARGKIEMQQFTAGKSGSAIGKRLMDVRLPAGTRLALIRHKSDEAFIPEAKSVVVAGDSLIMVGNVGAFEDARKLFIDEKASRQRIVIMGGSSMAVWLCRSLRDRNFSVRLFETDRTRAEELAEKLGWVTVIHADPTERSVFDEEHIAEADVFATLLDDDEANIISGVLAKLRGVAKVITVVQKSKFLDLIYDIGIDAAFSPRLVAAEAIDQELDESQIRHLGSLAEGVVDVLQIRVGDKAPVIDKTLKDIKLSPDWVVAAVRRDRAAHVPGGDETIRRGDVVLVVGKHGQERSLKKLFAAG